MNSKKKRLYLGIVLLGGLALLLDRFVLPAESGRPASARAASTSSARGTAGDAPKGELAALSIPQLHFPRLLPEADLSREPRDVFAPPERYLAPEEEDRSATDNPGGASAAGLGIDGRQLQSKAENFAVTHTLTAVMIQPRLKLAIVDGVWVNIGQEVDECVLTQVEHGSATFECRDGEAVLQVLEPARLLGD